MTTTLFQRYTKARAAHPLQRAQDAIRAARATTLPIDWKTPHRGNRLAEYSETRDGFTLRVRIENDDDADTGQRENQIVGGYTVAYLSKLGFSRGVAVDEVRRATNEHAAWWSAYDRGENQIVGVVVTASRGTVDLTTVSLWGNEVTSWRWRDLDDTARDLMSEAVTEAKRVLKTLCDCAD